MISQLKRGLLKTREILTTDIEDLFKSKKISDNLLDELEEILITADLGVQTTTELMERLKSTVTLNDISSPEKLKEILKKELLALFPAVSTETKMEGIKPHVIMVIGVNGVGKTTTIGKLAAKYRKMGKKVLIAASDTFRAAAIEQLAVWAARADADFVKHKANADPAAVAFDGIEAAKARKIDVVIVDTAGRLHTKINLMDELKKMDRVISKSIPGAPHETLLVLDATTGQNALSQAKLFNEAIGITGIIMAKLDGTARGGIIVSVSHMLNIPIKFIGVGEQIEDLQEFDAQAFINALFD